MAKQTKWLFIFLMLLSPCVIFRRILSPTIDTNLFLKFYLLNAFRRFGTPSSWACLHTRFFVHCKHFTTHIFYRSSKFLKHQHWLTVLILKTLIKKLLIPQHWPVCPVLKLNKSPTLDELKMAVVSFTPILLSSVLHLTLFFTSGSLFILWPSRCV